jgi:histidinol-phosphate aminotransferase
MPISRRKLLCQFGAGAVMTAALPSLAESGFGEFPRSIAEGRSGGPVILLSRNENAYGPSEKAIAAMRGAEHSANRYPKAQTGDLRDRIAKLHALEVEQIVLGCGSGEILTAAAAAFGGRGKKVITALPTFEQLGRAAQIDDAEIITVPLSKNYAHDLDGVLARTDAATGLIYICNPNNPTASITPRRDIEDFLQKLPRTAMVLIDEAYHHYVAPTASYASFIDQPVNDDRVIITRTFSTVYGLAGIRVGYAVASPETARTLSARCLPDGTNIVGALAAVSALDDTAYIRTCVKRNADDRQEFFNQANARMLRAIDSHTNFVMMSAQRPATEVVEHFKKNGVEIGRPFPPLDNYIRVTLGKPAEMAEFWRVWDLAPAHKMEM